jgi:hypothetical protein
MKKRFFIFIAALTFLFCGNSQAQNAYKFSEPKDSVAKIIWEKLKTEDYLDLGISRVIAALEKIDKKKCAEAEHFKSKTAMDFEFVIPSDKNKEGYDILTKYQLQCYQKTDGSWLAVINQFVLNVNVNFLIDIGFGEGIAIVYYKGGKKLSYPKYINCVFPDDFSSAIESDYWRSTKITFSDTEINCFSRYFAPVKLVWNGKTFEPSSKIIYNCVIGGSEFRYTSCSPVKAVRDDGFEYTFYNTPFEYNIGKKWDGSPDGIFYDGKKAIAKFDIKDGIIEGYTFLHPDYGFAMEFTEDHYIAAKPVTIGSPIQYVLNHLGEIPAAKDFKNGKFVVTLHTVHDMEYTGRDVFIEFTSKDENSPIETIRVYSKPLTVKE